LGQSVVDQREQGGLFGAIFVPGIVDAKKGSEDAGQQEAKKNREENDDH
jgi:hypothetical protein